MNLIIEAIKRLQQTSPDFFIKLRWIFGVLMVLGAALKSLIAIGVWNPSYAVTIDTISSYIATVAASVWGTSFLPIDKK